MPAAVLDWKTQNFAPIPFCNTYSLHISPPFYDTKSQPNEQYHAVFVCDVNGVLHCFRCCSSTKMGENSSSCWENSPKWTSDLKSYLPAGEIQTTEKPVRKLEEREQLASLELVASDMHFLPSSSNEKFPQANNAEKIVKKCLLATCWVVYDRLFVPEKCFAVLFWLSNDDTPSIESFKLFHLQIVPTYTKFNSTLAPSEKDEAKNHLLYWHIFGHSKSVCAFKIGLASDQIDEIPSNSLSEQFPMFIELQGSATRTCCWANNGSHNYFAIGFDNGYVVVSVFEKNSVIDRKLLKFDWPISVLAPLVSRTLSDGSELIQLLISTTVGPPTTWRVAFETQKLSITMANKLGVSEFSDAILTAELRHPELVLIGTYGDQLMFYGRDDLLTVGSPDHPQPPLEGTSSSQIAPVCVLNIVSPVLSVAVLPRRPLKDSRTVTAREEDEKVLNGKGNDEDGQEDEQERNQQQLVVLSYRGLHHFVGPIQLPPFLLPITNIPVVPGDS